MLDVLVGEWGALISEASPCSLILRRVGPLAVLVTEMMTPQPVTTLTKHYRYRLRCRTRPNYRSMSSIRDFGPLLHVPTPPPRGNAGRRSSLPATNGALALWVLGVASPLDSTELALKQTK